MGLLEDMPVEPTVALLVRLIALTYGGPGAPPTMYSGNTAFTPGSGPPPYAASTSSYAANSAQPYEWYAAPGPNRRGNMCITHVDSLRGYGFQSACPKK